MAKLTGQTIAASYDQLLIVGDANGITATAQAVESADTGGNASLLYLSTTEVYNPGTGGTSHTAFGKDSGVNLGTGTGNALFGEGAGADLTTGEHNVAVGYHALYQGTTESDDNVAIGYNAMSGGFTTATVNDNVAIGSGSMAGVLTDSADANTVVGTAAAASITKGAKHTAIGYQSLATEDVGDRSTAIGYQSLYGQNSDSDNEETGNTAIGYKSGYSNVTGQNNTYMGYSAGQGISTKSHSDCVFVGSNAGSTAYTGNNNIAIGSGAMNDIDADANVGASTENIFIGKDSGGGTWVTAASGYNVAIGNGTMSAALNAANENVAIGHNCFDSATTGDNNVFIGSSTGGQSTDIIGATAVGRDALGGATDTNANYTTAIGFAALAALTSGAGTVAIGKSAAAALLSGPGNTVVGYQAMDLATTAQYNTAIGWNAMSGVPASQAVEYVVAIGTEACLGTGSTTSDIAGAIAIGEGAGKSLTTGAGNSMVGYLCGDALQDGAGNTLMGRHTGGELTNQDYNTLIGHYCGDVTTAANTVAVGAGALGSAASASGTVAIGKNALNALVGGETNTAIGYHALTVDDEGDNNTAVGWAALATFNGAAGATDNTAVGAQAGFNVTTGIQGTFMGFQAGGADSAYALAGSGNTCFGWKSGKELQGAANSNTCIGSGAGDVITSGTTHTCLGAFTDPSGNTNVNQVVIGYGATGVGDATCTIGISANTASIALNGSATTWSAASSDERYKENIESSTAGLSFVNDLRPITYNWKKAKDVPSDMPAYKEGSDEPVLGWEYGETLHGFIAQEVKAAIDGHSEIKEGFAMWMEKDDGVQTVSDGTLVPILVKAVQELSQQVEDLKAKIN